MYVCNGILFNHESPRRGETFVTRKITRGVVDCLFGSGKKFFLGNLNSKRDWGHAKDYVEMQWLMLQQEIPEDFVIASGIQYSVRDFINQVSRILDIKIKWKGEGLEEIGYWNNQEIIKIDPRYFRATEVETLLGDASKAKDKLDWEPKISFEKLVEEMTLADLESAKKNELINKHGYKIKNYFE